MTVSDHPSMREMMFLEESGSLITAWPEFEDGTKVRIFIQGPKGKVVPRWEDHAGRMAYITEQLQRVIDGIKEQEQEAAL